MDKDLIARILEVYNDEADHEDIVLEEQGDWVQDYKYQICETIYKHEEKFYCVQQARSGSYHSDWDYQDPEVYEVKPVTKTITSWECV